MQVIDRSSPDEPQALSTKIKPGGSPRFYTAGSLFQLFSVCAFPIHLWSLVMAFRDLAWVSARTQSEPAKRARYARGLVRQQLKDYVGAIADRVVAGRSAALRPKPLLCPAAFPEDPQHGAGHLPHRARRVPSGPPR